MNRGVPHTHGVESSRNRSQRLVLVKVAGDVEIGQVRMALAVEEDVIGRTRVALEEAGALRKPGTPDEGAAAKPVEVTSPSEHGATVVGP